MARESDARSDGQRFEEFVGTIAALSKEVQRIKATESAELGLAGADIMVLYYLADSAGGMTGAELARAVGVSRAAVSRTLARMEQEGFVELSVGEDENRYRAPVRLTEHGQAAAVQARERIDYVMHAVSSALTPDERSQMYRSLARVLACLKGISRG